MKKNALYFGLDPSNYHSDAKITHCPLIQIIPRPPTDNNVYQAIKKFEEYSHIVITSKSTIPILLKYLYDLGLDLSIWQQKLTIAVGKGTAKCLIESGISVFRMAKEEMAEGVIEELKQLSLKEAYIFWPHSGQARSIISDYLEIEKIRHESCVVYDSKICVIESLPCLHAFDELIFTSPSTVDAFLSIFGEIPSGIILTPIGPVTARRLDSAMVM